MAVVVDIRILHFGVEAQIKGEFWKPWLPGSESVCCLLDLFTDGGCRGHVWVAAKCPWELPYLDDQST